MSAPMPERINLGRISMDAGEPIILDVKDIHLPPEYQAEYVRADLFDTLTARVKALEAALRSIAKETTHVCGEYDNLHMAIDTAHRVARAALKQEGE